MASKLLLKHPTGISRQFQKAVTRRKFALTDTNARIMGGYKAKSSAYVFNFRNVEHIAPPNPNNGTFFVLINSILYLGQMLRQNTETIQWPHYNNTTILDYWRNRARRQLGSHIYMARTSQIEYVAMYIYNKSLDPYGAYPINSIYPIICYYCRPLPNPSYKAKTHETRKGTRIQCASLSLGLEFKKYVEGSANYAEGERYYSRKQIEKETYSPISAGRVYELTEQILQQLANKNLTQYGSYFAIYVCSGAKLIVEDQYHEIQTAYEHNRSFLQAGAVVVVEGELKFTVPYVSGMNKQNEFIPKAKLTLKEAVDTDLLRSNASLKGVQNPVIFLGANESEYDSIAWQLSIRRGFGTNKAPEIALIIPDGGYINAIEEWNVGMPEVIARHRYECLHESSVSMKSIPNPIHCIDGFVAPTDAMLKRILGVDVNRCVIFNIKVPITTPTGPTDKDFITREYLKRLTQIENPLPIQYNFQRWNKINPNRNRDSRPQVPPLYPLFYLDVLDRDNPDETACYWIPTYRYPGNELKFVTDPSSGKVLSSDWFCEEETNLSRFEYKKNKYYYKLEKNRVINNPDALEMKEISSYPHNWVSLCDGISTRMGVNGRIYKNNANTEPIGEIISRYYYPYKNDWENWKQDRNRNWYIHEKKTDIFPTPQEVFSHQVENVE